MYWIQKYCLFHRYRRPVPGTDFINTAVYQIIYLGPLVFTLGNLTWSNFTENGFPESALYPNLASIGFSFFLLIAPIRSILVKYFFKDNF